MHIIARSFCLLKNPAQTMNKNHADSLQLDHDACGNLNSMIVPCCGDLRELKGGHYHKIVEITENAGKCLLYEYTVRVGNLFSTLWGLFSSSSHHMSTREIW